MLKHWRASRIAAALLIVIGSAACSEDPSDPSRTGGGVDTDWAVEQVFDGEEWAREAIEASVRIDYRRSSTLGLEPSDFASAQVNIIDGRRATIEVSEPQFVVWLFGGSTMFGTGQRDDHTIPSELVRVAQDRGVRIEAVNFGVESWVNWQGTLRFIEELTLGARPDAAVFYDGVNDMGAASETVGVGVVDRQRVRYFTVDQQERDRLAAEGTDVALTDAERREAMIDRASLQYRRGVELAQQIGQRCGVSTVHFWQPQLTATTPNPYTRRVLEHLGMDELGSMAARDDYESVLARAPLDVIDLRSVFDSADTPIYYDWAHTNERGARLVAEAMWPAIADRLVSPDASGDPSPTSCFTTGP